MATDGRVSFREVTFPSSGGTMVYGCLQKPHGEGKFPAVIMIHGGLGGNREFTRGLLEWSIAERLLLKGYVALSTDYRLDFQGRDVDDVVAAFEYLKGLPFVDGSRIVYFGDSHGSYLALMAATRTRPAAVIHCWGVANLAEWYRHIENSPIPIYREIARAIREGLGGTPDQLPELYRRFSAVAHAHKVMCPVLIIHGDEDDEVPVSHAYELAQALKDAQREYELKIFKGGGHGLRTRQARMAMDEAVIKFLAKHLGPAAS